MRKGHAVGNRRDFSTNHACPIGYTHARKKKMILLISIGHIDPNGNISEEIIEEHLQDFEVGKDFLKKIQKKPINC